MHCREAGPLSTMSPLKRYMLSAEGSPWIEQMIFKYWKCLSMPSNEIYWEDPWTAHEHPRRHEHIGLGKDWYPEHCWDEGEETSRQVEEGGTESEAVMWYYSWTRNWNYVVNVHEVHNYNGIEPIWVNLLHGIIHQTPKLRKPILVLFGIFPIQ